MGVAAYGRTGEDDVVKPRSPERNSRENATKGGSGKWRSEGKVMSIL
jgi:hypothetical protein